MKCSKCGFENPEGAKFCSNCGAKMEEMKCCLNPQCENYRRYILPQEALFCPECNSKIENFMDAPFHVRHPEYNLVPFNEFDYKDDVSFFFKKPEYIEDGYRSEGINYFYIARQEKLGILRYEYHKHWYGDYHITDRIIPCEYDKIERSEREDYFICYKGEEKTYIDNKGKVIK